MIESENGTTTVTSPGPVTLYFDQVVAPGCKSALECSLPGPSTPSGKGPATWRHIEGTLTKNEIAAFDDKNLEHVDLVARWIRQLVERELGVLLGIPTMPGIGISVDSTTALQISDILMANAQAPNGACSEPAPENPTVPAP